MNNTIADRFEGTKSPVKFMLFNGNDNSKINLWGADNKAVENIKSLDSYQLGMSVYAEVYSNDLTKSLAEVTQSAHERTNDLTLSIYGKMFDEEDNLVADWPVKIERDDNLAKETHYSLRFWIDPSLNDDNYQETDEFRTYLFLGRKINKPQKYRVEFEISYTTPNYNEYIQKRSILWDLSGENFNKWKELTEKVKAKAEQKNADNTMPSQAGQKNSKLENEIKNLLSDRMVKRVIIVDNDWNIVRNDYGNITHRNINVEVIYKKGSKFILSELLFKQDYVGGSWGKTKKEGVGLRQVEINEANIMK